MEDSRFFEGRDHSESEFAEVLADLSTEGVYQHADQKLLVTAPGGMLVNVAAGRAVVQGFWYRNPALRGVTISPNPAGQIRYDRIVLRLDRGANKVFLAVREGVPGSGLPALSRAIGGAWEVSLASVRVGPSVTNIAGGTNGDLSDERGYGAVCGWAGGRGALGPETVEGIPNFIAISPLDPNTGFQWTSADRIDIVAGAKPVATFSSTGNAIGAFDISTVIRGGGTVGAPQERIYVDSDFILIGRELGAGTGVPQIQIGTAVRTSAITIGHYTTSAMFATIYMHGIPVHMLPPVNNLISYNITDGFYTGFKIQNTAGTKQFNMLIATGAAAGLGAAGDASIYTDGTAAGRLLLGTQATARLHISSTYMAFGVQGVRTGGFSFQQVTNDYIGGIRQYHTNGAHRIEWYNDVSGRHVWGINDVPQMWLFTNGVLTVGGTSPKAGGFNFQQYVNHPSWGIRVYHTNAANNADFWMDDAARVVISASDIPQVWMVGGIFTFGGPSARGSGFNYQQAGANTVGYGIRIWHTDQGSHGEIYEDANARFVVAVNDVPRIHIHPNGAITFGAGAADTAALCIPATFGDTPASGIRMTNAGGVGVWWVRSDGVGIIGSATSQAWFHHGVRALTPDGDNVMSLGYAGYRWSNVVAHNGTFSGTVTATGGFAGLPNLSDPTFNNLTVNGTAHIANIAGGGTGPLYPTGNGSVQLGANGRSWGDIFGITYWKPGGGNGFNDTNASDDRLKLIDKFRPYDRGLAVILALRPTYFQYTGAYGTPAPGEEFHGFRAQELQEVAPEMVTPMMRKLDPSDPESPEEEFLTVNSGDLPYMLTLAVQELQAQIDELREMVQKGAA